jgi:hypothetical protein
VFNAYQRRLQQVDLVLAQRFIDGDKVTAEELQKLSEIIGDGAGRDAGVAAVRAGRSWAR